MSWEVDYVIMLLHSGNGVRGFMYSKGIDSKKGKVWSCTDTTHAHLKAESIRSHAMRCRVLLVFLTAALLTSSLFSRSSSAPREVGLPLASPLQNLFCFQNLLQE